MFAAEPVTLHRTVTDTSDPLGDDVPSGQGDVALTALVAIGDTRESFDNQSSDVTVSYTLYFVGAAPGVTASDEVTVRGDRCHVVSGPNGRWAQMGEVVAVRRTAQRT